MNIEKLVERYKNENPIIIENKNLINKNPLVSIIIITYQHKNYIKDCIESVINQKTDFAYEILIGDDGSTDGTTEICIDYAKRYHEKITLYIQSRRNVLYIGGKPTGRFNMLFLLSKVKGKYIAIVEGDDYWADNCKLENQVKCFIEDKNVSECFNPVFVVNEKKQIIQNYYGPAIIKKYYSIEDLLIYGNFIPTSSIMLKRETVENIPEWFLKIPVGDWPLNILSALHGKMKILDKKMSIWRQHKTGGFSLKDNYYKLVLETKCLYIFRKNLSPKYRRIIENKISRNLLQLYLDFDKNINMKKLRKIALYSIPFSIKFRKLKIVNLKLFIAVLFPKLYKYLKKILNSKISKFWERKK